MSSLNNSSDDEEEFTGFSREERALLRDSRGEQDSSDDEDETSDEDEELTEDLVWDKSTDDVDVLDLTQPVGPTRTMPPN